MVKHRGTIVKVHGTVGGDLTEVGTGWERGLGHFVGDGTVTLGAADAFGGVESGEDEFDAGGAHGGVLGGVDLKGFVPHRRDSFEQCFVVGAGKHVADFDADTFGEDLSDLIQTVLFDVFFKNSFDGFCHDGIEYLLFAHLVTAHQVYFEFSQRRRIEVSEVADAGDGGLFSKHGASAAGAGDHCAVVGEAEAGAHAGLLIDVATLTSFATDLFNDLLHEPRDGDWEFAIERQVAFLFEDTDSGVTFVRIVSADQAADAVFELGDNFAAAVVGGGVCREEDHDIEIKLDGVAANLDIAFFEDVEESDLDEFIEFREFVHGEKAAVHAWDQSKVEGLFGGHAGAGSEPGGIDFSDDICEASSGCESFGISLFAGPPADGDLVCGHFGDAAASLRGNWFVGIFVDWAVREVKVGKEGIEESGEHPHDAAFALSFFAEEEDVVAGEKCEADIGDDGVFVADHPGKEFFAGGEESLEVFTDLLFDSPGFPA